MNPTPPTAIRINRYLSMCGIASRRKADDLIREGKVEVNGETPTDPGFTIDPDRDRVVVNGMQVVRTHEPTYLVLNKPKDAITTLDDDRGRPTVMNHITARRRVYPVGRLDRNTTGVLLFTDDGQFANRLMHPRYHVPKTYLVTCSDTVTREHLRNLAEGVALPDGTTAPAEIGVVGGSKASRIVITIREGRNRQVRRMFEHLGYEVTKLDRIAYGPVTLQDLPRGASRPLTPQEIRTLERLAGMDGPDEQVPPPVTVHAASPDGHKSGVPHPGSKPRSGPPGERTSGGPPRDAKRRPAPPGERKFGGPPRDAKRRPGPPGERRPGGPPGDAKWRRAPSGERRPGGPPGDAKRRPGPPGERRPGGPPRDAKWRPAPSGERKSGGLPRDAKRRPGPPGEPKFGGAPRDAKWRPGPPGERKFGGSRPGGGRQRASEQGGAPGSRRENGRPRGTNPSRPGRRRG